ncbi:MAG: PGF-pre-PGF domain-containing protein, partial [Candidatus Aenigmarchaeota archaeon]|nr:PGF-pre-PGF domain-containing protein [Candidatus Aenigmarchaeota archaeon]
TITSPGNATNTTDSTPEIFFNITDNVHNATNLTYRIYVDGSVVTVNDTTNNTNIAYNFTALTNGTHNFRVEVNDPSGNGYNTTLFNITVDNVNPGVTITSPGNSTNTTDSTPEIRFNVSDNVHARNLTYRIYMDGTMQTANDTNNNTIIAYNFTALINGTHRFTVEVTDPSGGVFNASFVTITIDNVNPVAATVSPANETSTTDTTPEIYFNITDNVHATNLTYRIYVGSTVDTTGATINNTNVAYNLSALVEGSYIIRIEATDPSGNAANSTALFLYSTVTTTTTTVASGGSSSFSDTSKQSWNVLGEGVTKINVAKSGIAIGIIELDVKNSVSNAKITVEKVSGVDAVLAEKMAADVYQYIEITPESIKSSDIKTAAITFTVTKSWLAQNNFGKENVVLMRYTTGWDELSTKVASETSSDVTFSAETPGFSTFAIVARAAPAVTTTTLPGTTTTVPATTTTTVANIDATPTTDYTTIIIAALVVAGLAAYAFRNKPDTKGKR